MYSLILFLPLLSFFISFYFGFYLGREFSLYISLFIQFISLNVIILCFYEILLSKSTVILMLSDWFIIDIFNIVFCIYLDALTCSMLFIVFFISFCVNFFSVSYMSTDPFIIRFFSYLSFFVFFMLFLVTSDIFYSFLLVEKGLDYVLFY